MEYGFLGEKERKKKKKKKKKGGGGGSDLGKERKLPVPTIFFSSTKGTKAGRADGVSNCCSDGVNPRPAVAVVSLCTDPTHNSGAE